MLVGSYRGHECATGSRMPRRGVSGELCVGWEWREEIGEVDEVRRVERVA